MKSLTLMILEKSWMLMSWKRLGMNSLKGVYSNWIFLKEWASLFQKQFYKKRQWTSTCKIVCGMHFMLFVLNHTIFFYTDYLTPVESDWENFFMDLWCLFLKKPLDDLSLGRFGTFFVKLKNIFYEFKVWFISKKNIRNNVRDCIFIFYRR